MRPFHTVEELPRVPGIGTDIIDRVKTLVTVGSRPVPAPVKPNKRCSLAEILGSFKRLKYPDQQRLILRLIHEGLNATGKDWLRRQLSGEKKRQDVRIDLNATSVTQLSRIPHMAQMLAETIVDSRPIADLIFVASMNKDLLLQTQIFFRPAMKQQHEQEP